MRRPATAAAARAERALGEFRLDGAPTNIPFLRALLADRPCAPTGCTPASSRSISTRLIAAAAKLQGGRYFAAPASTRQAARARRARRSTRSIRWRCWPTARRATAPGGRRRASDAGRKAAYRVRAPLQGTIVSLAVARGRCRARRPAAADHGIDEDGARDQAPTRRLRARDHRRGRRHGVRGPSAGLHRGGRHRGAAVPRSRRRSTSTTSAPTCRVLDRHAMTLDAARPDAVGAPPQDRPAHHAGERRRPARSRLLRRIRRAGGRRRAAAARVEELIDQTPADGLVMGLGRVNGDAVRRGRRACAVTPTTTRCWPAPRAPTTTTRWTA